MITINPINYTSPNFMSFRNTIKNQRGEIINRGDTTLFRLDFDFKNFNEYIINKYKSIPKVNFIAHACSDGEEIFSIISYLINTFGEKNTQKFFPVSARDIENEHIKLAKRGEYKINYYERAGIEHYLGNKFYNYFSKISDNEIKVKDFIKDKVHFSQSDILEDINKINFSNTILLARNFWHYINENNAIELAKKLREKMDNSSTLVIGDFDKEFKIDRLLKNFGFLESKFAENVFEIKK